MSLSRRGSWAGLDRPYLLPTRLLRVEALLCLSLIHVSASGQITNSSQESFFSNENLALDGHHFRPGPWSEADSSSSPSTRGLQAEAETGVHAGPDTAFPNQIKVCVLEASPFVSLKPGAMRPGQNNGPVELHLEDFIEKFQGFDVDLITAITRWACCFQVSVQPCTYIFHVFNP